MKRNKSVFLLFFLMAGIVLSILSCTAKQESSSDTSSIKFKQYYIAGEQLFVERCSNCHQKSGKGLGLLYPPVNTSDFIDANFENVLCLIRNGITGELIVNGKSFNKEMPGIPLLTDLEIAEITTYLYNTWGRKKGIIEVKEASKILSKCDH